MISGYEKLLHLLFCVLRFRLGELVTLVYSWCRPHNVTLCGHRITARVRNRAAWHRSL